MDAPNPTPIQLGYAQPPPWYQRRRVRRIGEVVAVVLLLGVIVLWAPRIFRFIDSNRWDQQCRKWDQPVSIVFDSTKTAQTPNNPNCWQQYVRYTAFAATQEQLIYLHGRRSVSGRERLVAISMISTPNNGNQFVYIRTQVCGSHDWFSSSGELCEDDKPLLQLWTPAPTFPPQPLPDHPNNIPDLQIDSGQADAADQSHFTFECKLNEKTITIDGWLRSDDTVRLEPRNEITPPPPSSAPSSH